MGNSLYFRIFHRVTLIYRDEVSPQSFEIVVGWTHPRNEKFHVNGLFNNCHDFGRLQRFVLSFLICAGQGGLWRIFFLDRPNRPDRPQNVKTIETIRWFPSIYNRLDRLQGSKARDRQETSWGRIPMDGWNVIPSRLWWYWFSLFEEAPERGTNALHLFLSSSASAASK